MGYPSPLLRNYLAANSESPRTLSDARLLLSLSILSRKVQFEYSADLYWIEFKALASNSLRFIPSYPLSWYLVQDGELHLLDFPPSTRLGDILYDQSHIQILKSEGCCGDDSKEIMEVTEMWKNMRCLENTSSAPLAPIAGLDKMTACLDEDMATEKSFYMDFKRLSE